ncbi:dipeptide/oligopeptide/nickel ABC transporter permease/ATP-binding protein [Actinospica durhamensis]|uniref:Dipeptide/oligopeptide/nickel ABC transporter permease/ATP-binding protein n=1 Tax=Actinospica durhamensis TaxID=1508375 RepID=A0A941IQQ5_9ACTN|nr:dipeptide/oligopeptide/nickel ABC transporter permease/ATP-binding protein [Actinospica durhamensis]MBR7837945.1 dipeptide/oligopeptide/nickel ABC transporter permease/ATP-binding protein [Actinospica durhamensis]
MRAPSPRSPLRAVLRNPLGAGSAAVLLLVLAAVLLAPVLRPGGAQSSNILDAYDGAAAGHPFGFDGAGRDELAMLLYGGRATLGEAGLALLIALILGLPLGLCAGYFAGRFDAVGSWAVNLVMALPGMVVLLAARAVLGPTTVVLMVVLGVLIAPSFFRLARGVAADLRGELFIDAARVAGLPAWRILTRHVLVAVRAPVLIQASLVAGVAIGMQAALGFLGISTGVSAPSWGGMLSDAYTSIYTHPILMLWPGLALGLTTAALLLLAVALRDALEDRPGQASARRTRRPEPVRVVPTPAAAAGPARAAARSPLLSIRGLTVAYAGPQGAEREVVHGVDLDVRPGEVLGLVGESGSGKTQTALSVLGLLPLGGRITGGSVLIDGAETVGADERALRRLRGGVVGYVPQEPMSNLDPCFTIGSQLAEPLRAVLGLGRREAAARVLDLLRAVEIADPARVARSYPHEISGGMAQRVLIAGAVSCEPRLLVADEPTTALDVSVQAEILDLLRRLQQDQNLGLLLVTHNLGVVADLCDRVAVMRAGAIVETGEARQILHAPEHEHTRALLDAVLDDAPVRAPWQARPTRSVA